MTFKSNLPYITFIYESFLSLIYVNLFYFIFTNILEVNVSDKKMLTICIVFFILLVIGHLLRVFLTNFKLTEKHLIIKSYPFPLFIKPLKIKYEDIISINEEKSAGSYEITKDISFTKKNSIYIIYRVKEKYNEDITGSRLKGKNIVDINGDSYKLRKCHFTIKDKEEFEKVLHQKILDSNK